VLGAVDRALAIAERRISLVERCHPTNYIAEQRRLLEAWRTGTHCAPHWQYAPRPDLADVQVTLEAVVAHLSPATRGAKGPPAVWADLYLARAAELLVEASLVRAIGTRAFAASAGLRFRVGDASTARRARELAGRWIRERPPAAEPRTRSDSESEPRSLVNTLRRAVGARRLPVRVEVRRDMAAVAAAAEDVVFVRSGLELRERDVERIVVHEIDGHVVPRLAARRATIGLLTVGTARSEDEEGRALALEGRTGGFDALRRGELGRRHLAALSVRDGATWSETTQLLCDSGASEEQAVAIASRCHRGGGLAREIVYLTSLVRYQDAMAVGVPLERWMARGRIGISAARQLHDEGVLPQMLSSPEAA